MRAGFVMQSFIDELAYAAGKDPLAFRMAFWGCRAVPAAKPAPGRARRDGTHEGRSASGGAKIRMGFAHAAKGSAWACLLLRHRGYFASVAEVQCAANNKVKVNKIWVAADIGSQVINPGKAQNSAQGAVIEA